jgi:hypothetical protein
MLCITTVSCSQFIFRFLGSYLGPFVAVTSVTIIVRKFEREDRINRELGIIVHQAYTHKKEDRWRKHLFLVVVFYLFIFFFLHEKSFYVRQKKRHTPTDGLFLRYKGGHGAGSRA